MTNNFPDLAALAITHTHTNELALSHACIQVIIAFSSPLPSCQAFISWNSLKQDMHLFSFVLNMPVVFSSFPLSPTAINNQVILLSMTHTRPTMKVIHLNSLNTGADHDYAHLLDCIAKTPSPPASCIHWKHAIHCSNSNTTKLCSCLCFLYILKHA